MNDDLNFYLNNFDKIWNEKCSQYDYLPNILPPVNRIIVIGDIHGDFEKTKELLKVGKVIDNSGNWIGGDTIVVQLGDQVDSCRYDGINSCSDPKTTKNDKAHDITILKYMTSLHKKAQRYGGAVYSLLGNHELMNVEGDMTYVSYKNLMQYGTVEARVEKFKPGNELAEFLACTRKMVLIIGSNLFVHAGIVPEMVKKYNIDDMNKLLSLYLLDEIKQPRMFKELFMSSKYSPLWNRVFGDINNSTYSCEQVMKPLEEVYKVGRIYVGHTPQIEKGINSTCNDRIWLADIGVSKSFDNFDNNFIINKKRSKSREAQVLEILNDNNINILV
jgi:hypothetical protein